jgi:uroporphyrinogen-III synthase
MMNALAGKRIALLETRLGSELAKLVERQGGTAIPFPALREATIEASAEVAELIVALDARLIDMIVFQTGVGVAALLKEAEKIGRLEELLTAMGQITKVCRGPKPTAVLARHGLKPDVAALEPYTTDDVIAALERCELNQRGVALLHYGERNLALAQELSAHGARLTELCLYEWQMPEDITPLTQLIAQLDQRVFASVVFTSQIQARHLFQVAGDDEAQAALADSLNHKTVTASIGPTCSAALRSLGVNPHVEPEHPKMGPLVSALARHLVSDKF